MSMEEQEWNPWTSETPWGWTEEEWKQAVDMEEFERYVQEQRDIDDWTPDGAIIEDLHDPNLRKEIRDILDGLEF